MLVVGQVIYEVFLQRYGPIGYRADYEDVTGGADGAQASNALTERSQFFCRVIGTVFPKIISASQFSEAEYR